jgi:hypothetical protein
MRKLAIWIVLVVTLPGYSRAHAQTRPQCTYGQSGPKVSSVPPPSENPPLPDSAICEGRTEDSAPSSYSTAVNTTSGANTSAGTTQRLATNTAAPAIKYIRYDRVTTGPDGQPCVTTGYYAEGTRPNDSADLDPVTQNIRDIHNLPPLEYPPCPIRPRSPGEPETLEAPSMIARRYWEQVVLPKPQPAIAPGRAITGKLAYLETKGQTARTYMNSTVVGPLRIDATGSYTVTWGDGETSGPYRFEGAPWPTGQITHQYSKVGVYYIVVTEQWTATWSLGGESGVLRTLQTSGTIVDFPVEEIQAVIGR